MRKMEKTAFGTHPPAPRSASPPPGSAPSGPHRGVALSAGALPARASTRRGVVLSVEALLAALLLFGSLLIAAELSALSSSPPSGLPALRLYVLDAARLGVQSGAFTGMLSGFPADDSRALALAAALPPSVCLQLETYYNTTTPDNLTYSYVPAGCNLTLDTPKFQWWRAVVRRDNSSSNEFYWVRTVAYPSGS